MSIYEERQKATEEHRKFLEANTKDEQARYNDAKDNADKMSKQLSEIIKETNEAKIELELIRKEKVNLSNELYLAKNDLAEIKAKSEILLKRMADKERDFERTVANFDNYKKQQRNEIEKERGGLIELQRGADLALSEVKSEKLSLINMRKISEDKETEISLKIAELKNLMYEHSKIMAKNDQDRAKLQEERSQVDEDKEINNKALKAIENKETALSMREKQAKDKEIEQKDRDIEQNHREAILNKKMRQIDCLIDTNHLKDKI